MKTELTPSKERNALGTRLSSTTSNRETSNVGYIHTSTGIHISRQQDNNKKERQQDNNKKERQQELQRKKKDNLTVTATKQLNESWPKQPKSYQQGESKIRCVCARIMLANVG